MGRFVSAVWFLALTACSSDAPAPPAAAPPAEPAAAPAPLGRAAPSAPGDYADEVDDLLQSLTGGPATAAPPPVPSGAPRRMVPTIAPGSPATAEARLNAYEENLTACLDGRFPAFCDHALLTGPDAARVQQAEHDANLTTCIDPQWQHLCNPGLLPATGGVSLTAPNAGAAPAGAPAKLLP